MPLMVRLVLLTRGEFVTHGHKSQGVQGCFAADVIVKASRKKPFLRSGHGFCGKQRQWQPFLP
jgi:hypothetical protein